MEIPGSIRMKAVHELWQQFGILDWEQVCLFQSGSATQAEACRQIHWLAEIAFGDRLYSSQPATRPS